LEGVIDGFPKAAGPTTMATAKGSRGVVNFENKIKNAQDLHQIENLLLNLRYWKVNPQSYSRHRTCEFRQHAGTTDFVKISSGIRFLSNLVDYSEQYEVTTKTLATLKNFNSMK
jgi:hypothetical protein